jgi:multidrug transporter EmrE-like cation transporter
MKEIILILVSILFGAIGQILMKYGTMHASSANGEGVLAMLLKYFTNLPILAGLSFYALSAVIWIFAISKVELSFAYPMVALGYVVVVIASYFLFGEGVSALRIAGLVTIIAGVLMIAKS